MTIMVFKLSYAPFLDMTHFFLAVETPYALGKEEPARHQPSDGGGGSGVNIWQWEGPGALKNANSFMSNESSTPGLRDMIH